MKVSLGFPNYQETVEVSAMSTLIRRIRNFLALLLPPLVCLILCSSLFTDAWIESTSGPLKFIFVYSLCWVFLASTKRYLL